MSAGASRRPIGFSTTLKAALNYCFSEKLAASDAEWRRVKPFRNVESAKVKYLQVAEAKRFINACDPCSSAPLAQAALQTGCRYGELTRLKVGDFNADSGTLAIWQSKSGKPRHVILTARGLRLLRRTLRRPGQPRTDDAAADGGPWRKSNQADSCCAMRARNIAPIESPRAAPHLGKLGDHGRNAVHGCRAQSRSRDTKMVEAHYGHLSDDFVDKAVRAHAPKFGFKPADNVRVL